MIKYNRSDYLPFLSWLILITITSLFIFFFSSCSSANAAPYVNQTDTLSTQTKKISLSKTNSIPQKWTLGIYGGVVFPSAESPIINMPCISIEAEYNLTSYITIIGNGTYNFIKTNEFSSYEQDGLPKESSRFFEISIGGRYYLGKELPRFFTDINVLYYKLKYQFENGFWEVQNANSGNIGFNAEMGLDVRIFRNIILSTKLKYAYLFVVHDYLNQITYFAFNSGIKYIF